MAKLESIFVGTWTMLNPKQEHITTGIAYTLLPLSRGYYMVVAEAYDALGNSVLSDPLRLRFSNV